MSGWIVLPVGVLVVAAGRFGRGRVPHLDWGLGALALAFLAVAGLRQELALPGLYLALLAAGAMFPDERGTWPYTAGVACAAVAGLTGALAPLAAGAAAALAAYAAVSRELGVRRARRRTAAKDVDDAEDASDAQSGEAS